MPQPEVLQEGSSVLSSSFFSVLSQADPNLVLVFLNYHLPPVTPALWAKAALRLCADGGANRLYDELAMLLPGEQAEQLRHQHIPDIIKGDLDSIRPDVREFYAARGTKIMDESHDQDSTDLQKCLTTVDAWLKDLQKDAADVTVVALGALGGRLDHTMSNLSTLHKWRGMHLVLVGDCSVARLLHKGRSIIRPDRAIEGPTCGLIPLTGPAIATTSGLRWNLDHTNMAFTGLLSTSNLMAADEICVETDSDLVWTCELRSRDSTAC